jgi:hypothetical protein
VFEAAQGKRFMSVWQDRETPWWMDVEGVIVRSSANNEALAQAEAHQLLHTRFALACREALIWVPVRSIQAPRASVPTAGCSKDKNIG